MSTRKVVVCGAGFLGRNIARTIIASPISEKGPNLQVQVSSRNPLKVWESLAATDSPLGNRLLPPVPVDITKPSTIAAAFQHADVVVSLVGIMHGSPREFEDVQLKGAENVAYAAKDVGAKLIHFSAIGADPSSTIPYSRTKGLAEQAIFAISPNATVIRPSLVFGPEDDFFNRFAKLSKVMPFLPVFGGGISLFQPVFVGDIAKLICHLSSPGVDSFNGKVIEACGPEVFTYRELMEIILETTKRRRFILSFPFIVGMLQGTILEKLPVNLFTVTRAQVQQLRNDNISSRQLPPNHTSLQEALSTFSSTPLHTVRGILPTYIY